jgi:hypothetical protein
MQEARELHISGFFYVPFDEVLASHDLSRHYRLAAIFAPLNWIDHFLIGNEAPVKSVTWSLSSKDEQAGDGAAK